MKRITVAFVLALVLVLGLVGVASAITNGQPDGDDHPYVGLMVAQYVEYDTSGEPTSVKPLWRCSGTLISETLFLTAGHCTEAPANYAEIWFDDGPIDRGSLPDLSDECLGETGYPCSGDVGGEVFTHQSYNPAAFFLYDLGVVELDEPWTLAGGYGA
ncbi:unnamed protein product, partial [marine sediment metagenome]